MKRIFLPLLALGALGSCTKDEAPDIPVDGRIRITAAIAGTSAPAVPAASGTQTPQTRGIVLGSQAQTGLVLLRVDDASDTAPASFAGAAYITADRAADGTLSNFSTPQTYALDDSHAWFTGFHPAGTKGSDQTSWTLSAGGTQDILLTADAWSAGRHTAPVTAGMTFGHALALLQVSCMADAAQPLGAVQATWGKITKIELLETAATATYTYADRKMAFTGSTALALSKSDCQTAFAPVTLDATNQLCAGGMFAPAASGTEPLKLKIYTEKKTSGVEVSVQLRNGATPAGFAAGMTHKATLVFDAQNVRVATTASTSDWNLSGNITGEIGTASSVAVYDYYYSDGSTSPVLDPSKTAEGIVFWVNPDNPVHYKVVWKDEYRCVWSTTAPINVGTTAYERIRDGNTNGNVNAVARNNGGDNEAVLDRWLADPAVNTTSLKSINFPAIKYFEISPALMSWKGWYLPAVTELQYLCCAYNGADPAKWASGNNSGITANTAAQQKFNTLFGNIGGRGFGYEGWDYWSSTEYDGNNSWFVGLMSTYTGYDSKTNNCVARFIKDVNSYPYVVEGKIVVSKDELGAAANIFHDPWTASTMPRHTTQSPDNAISARMEVAKTDCGTSTCPGVPWKLSYWNRIEYTWDDALKACARYTQPGGAIGTWRLMTETEFIVVRALEPRSSNKLNDIGILTWSDYGWYWLSSETSESAARTGNTHMGYDRGASGKGSYHVVRCVRDDVPNPTVTYPYVLDGAIIVSKDGYSGTAGPFHVNWTSSTIPTHNETGADNALAEKFQVAKEDCNSTNVPGVTPDYSTDNYYWANAVAACAAYTQTGTTHETTAGNWRLPTRAELELIYAEKGKLTGVDDFTITLFGTPQVSATESNQNSARVWSIDFDDGRVYSFEKASEYFVRCVRDI